MISIELINAKLHAFHGLIDGEEKIGNEYIVNLNVKFDEKDNDFEDISSTIDYSELFNIVKQRMQIPTNILEKICINIIRHIKHQYPFVKEVDLSIQKVQAPIADLHGNVGVSMNKKFND